MLHTAELYLIIIIINNKKLLVQRWHWKNNRNDDLGTHFENIFVKRFDAIILILTKFNKGGVIIFFFFFDFHLFFIIRMLIIVIITIINALNIFFTYPHLYNNNNLSQREIILVFHPCRTWPVAIIIIIYRCNVFLPTV